MVDDLAAGALMVECRAIAAGAGAPLFAFPADAWGDDWRLIVDDKSATLWDEAGAKYKLRHLAVASVDPPRAAGGVGEAVAQLALQAERDPGIHRNKSKPKGAPEQYEWTALEAALAKHFDQVGTPVMRKELAETERWALAWLQKYDLNVKNSSNEPATSTIRIHVKKAIDSYEKQQAGALNSVSPIDR